MSPSGPARLPAGLHLDLGRGLRPSLRDGQNVILFGTQMLVFPRFSCFLGHSGAPSADSGATGTDSGAPSPDSVAPSAVSGAPSTDSGAPSADSDAPSTDSGAPGTDSGAPSPDPL